VYGVGDRANRGIGRAVTARLHSLGHRVVVTARAERAALDVAAELGHPAIGIALDVTDAESVERVRTRAGHVDMQSLTGEDLQGAPSPSWRPWP
jgi:NAD(P)-dependent dehydrogenase (short-subunit alcohol dehydrogenase family)